MFLKKSIFVFFFFYCVFGIENSNSDSRDAFLNCVADNIPQDLGSSIHDFVRILDLKNGPFFDVSKVNENELKQLCGNVEEKFVTFKTAYQQCNSTDPKLTKAMIGSINAYQYLCRDIPETMEIQKCISSIIRDLQEIRIYNAPKYTLVGPIGALCQHATGFYHAYGKKLKDCGFEREILIGFENYAFIGVTAKKELPNMKYEDCAYKPEFP